MYITGSALPYPSPEDHPSKLFRHARAGRAVKCRKRTTERCLLHTKEVWPFMFMTFKLGSLEMENEPLHSAFQQRKQDKLHE